MGLNGYLMLARDRAESLMSARDRAESQSNVRTLANHSLMLES